VKKLPIADCQLPIGITLRELTVIGGKRLMRFLSWQLAIGNRQSEIFTGVEYAYR
jgi:hypothetical protein